MATVLIYESLRFGNQTENKSICLHLYFLYCVQILITKQYTSTCAGTLPRNTRSRKRGGLQESRISWDTEFKCEDLFLEIN